MNRITQQMVSGSTLNDLGSALKALQRSSNELSSGKRILAPSDDPYGASRAIDLQSQLDGLSSYAQSVKDGVSWSQAASGALGNVGEVLQRIRELTLQASNGTVNASDMANIGKEIAQLTEVVKQDANTQYAGQYVFSGTATSTAPYKMGAEDAYLGNAETVSRSVAPGTTVPISTDISSLMGSGPEAKDGKLLDVLRTISKHLAEGTPEAKSALDGADLKALDSNMQTLIGLQASAGATIDQLQTAANSIETLQSSITQTLSNTQDADYAKTTIAYSNEKAAYQAALHAGASIVQESLLNFLH